LGGRQLGLLNDHIALHFPADHFRTTRTIKMPTGIELAERVERWEKLPVIFVERAETINLLRDLIADWKSLREEYAEEVISHDIEEKDLKEKVKTLREDNARLRNEIYGRS